MGLTGISEFTFGFAFLYEQTNRYFGGLTAVPILPSLQQEAGMGWDAHLPVNGVPNYYQFKLSDYLVRSNARFIADGTYDAPYYRFSLHRRNYNQQHNRLRELSANFPETYYVAPEMNDVDGFNQAFINAQIFAGSRIIPVIECSDIDDGDQHYITYQPGNPQWIEHSEPKVHERSFTGKDINQLFAAQRQKMARIDEDFAKAIFQAQTDLTIKVLESEHRLLLEDERGLLNEPRERTMPGFLQAASEQAMTFFGATLVIVGEGKR